jgi:hypothetical protein
MTRAPLAAVPLRDPAGDDAGDDVVALLREILAELRRLNGAMPQRVPARSRAIPEGDRDRLDVLLRTVTASWGANRVFTIGELVVFAAALDVTPRRELRAALEAIGSARRIGMFCRRMSAIVVNNLAIERVGGDRSGSILIVRECES